MLHSMLEMSADITRVLFVGTSNTCRSPVAEAVLRKKVLDAQLNERIHIASAGTRVNHSLIGQSAVANMVDAGLRADSRSQHAAAFRGYSLLNHRPQQLCVEDFERFDFIFAMDWLSLRAVQNLAPELYRHKVELLMRYAHNFDDAEIPDPYYLNQAAFNRVVDYVEDAVVGLFDVLVRKSCTFNAA